MTKEAFLNLFPYPTIRKHQLEILTKIYNNYDKYDNFIIQAPTGTGKSAIAYTLCNSVPKAMILTGTKLLQNQYMKEFPLFECIKGRSSYKCNEKSDKNCLNAPCMTDDKFDNKNCIKTCCYQAALEKLKYDNAILTNYACLINNASIKARKNDVVVFDEAHNLEDQLVEIQAFNIDKEKLIDKYKLDEYIDDLEDTLATTMILTGLAFDAKSVKKFQYKNIELPRNVYILKVIQELLYLKLKYFALEDDNDVKIREEITKLYNRLKVYTESYNNPNWIVDVKDKNNIVIQPLDISELFNKFTKNFNKKFFMSATIISVKDFVDTFKLNPHRTAYIEVDEVFNPTLSPIVSYPVGKMGYNDIANTIPNIVKAVKDILDIHKNEKGIILTNNYKVTEAIIKGVDSKRLIHKYEKEYYYLSNEEMYEKHINGKKNSVLISPSMNTGVDLPDDQCRFEIIVKLPYDSLGDKRIKYKAKEDRNWYLTRMIRTFIQSCGRCVRNDKDWAVIYVLDSSFLDVMGKEKNKLSDTFYSRFKYNCEFDLKEFKEYINSTKNSLNDWDSLL